MSGLELSEDYRWTTAKDDKSIIFRKGKGRIVLPLRDIYRLEYDLWSWLDSRGLGHIKARYSEDGVIYRVCGKRHKYRNVRIWGSTSFLWEKFRQLFCRISNRNLGSVLDYGIRSDKKAVCTDDNKKRRKKHKQLLWLSASYLLKILF